MKRQSSDFEPKKWPSQERSQRTFDAIVEACARLLRRHGYAALTTNHIAEVAGVGIASVYEYFPDKDVVVAQVAEKLIERVMVRLQKGMQSILESPRDDAVELWIEHIYATLQREKDLIAVFTYQFPHTNRIPRVREVTPLLMRFSQAAAGHAGIGLASQPAQLHLLINLVSSTILQLLLNPPEDATVEEMIAALSHRVADWLTE